MPSPDKFLPATVPVGSLDAGLSMKPSDSAATDLTLLLAVAQRDEAAFSGLYDRFSRPVFSMIVRIVHSHAEAEEVLQEAFWQVWERAPAFRAELGSPFCWVATIARRKAIDRLRANSRHLQRLADAQAGRTEDDFAAPVALAALTADETGATVRAALAKLNPDERRAIVLGFFDGLTQAEIAEALRVPVGTIKARIRRGLIKLKAPLAAVRPGANSEVNR
jgi:RNA polymerase sigma-70 factor (ECF subfamily)